MNCPYCGKNDDFVVDSRSTDGRAVIRRRRECHACGRRFTTYERIEKTSRMIVIKKDGSRVPFAAENILKGLHAACGKRPIAEEIKLRLAQEIEEELYRDFDREAPSAEIGRRVAVKLREIDQIAYIRYASEYHDFRTLDDFSEELAALKARPRDLPNQRGLFAEE